jgi:hypothetical protein
MRNFNPKWFSVMAVAAALYWIAAQVLTAEQWAAGIGPQVFESIRYACLFVGASLSGGAFIVSKLTLQKKEYDGFWPMSFATGALAFSLCLGWLGWLGFLHGTQIALPLAFIALGMPTLIERFPLPGPIEISRWQIPLFMFGGICVALILFQVLSPDNVNYDAQWYHLRAAERHAMAGKFVRTPEGDQLLSLPQLSSWLYTWAFLHNATIDQNVRLALMMELSVYLGTVALIPAFVRRLIPTASRGETAAAGVTLFLFPSIFIYDTGIMGGSDHIVAFWALSAMVCWFDARQSRSFASWVFFGLHATGFLAKYSSLYLLTGLIPVVLVDVFWRAQKRDAGRTFRLLAATASVALALTAPYWLRNIVWYHNPVYPLAHSVFPSTPWNSDAQAWLANYQDSVWGNNGSWQSRFLETVKAFYNYQTKPYTWDDFVAGQAVFGFSYFASLCVLVFLREHKRRLFLMAALIHIGIAVWFNTHQHHMRYLTVLMPLMAASASAVGVSFVSSSPRLGRLAIFCVFAAHVVLYADVPFRKTHRMAGRESTVGIGTNYIANHGPKSSRLSTYAPFDMLPPEAVVLIHGVVPPLGFPRRTVSDAVGFQFGINYSEWGSAAEIAKQLRFMGVTHLAWANSVEQADSIGGEALFQFFANQTTEQIAIAGFTVGELPTETIESGDSLLFVGCDAPLFETGLYSLKSLFPPVPPANYPWPKVPHESVPSGQDWRVLLPKASFVAIEPTCGSVEDTNFKLVVDQASLPVRIRHFIRVSGAEGKP